MEYSPTPFAATGPAGRISRGNRAFYALLSLAHDDNYIGKSWNKLSPAHLRGAEKMLLDQSAVTANPVSYEKLIILPSGDTIPVSVTAHPVKGGGHWYLLHRQENGRQFLDAGAAHFEAITRAYDGMIYICSPEYRIEYMNEALKRRVGRDATGEKCHKVMHQLDQPCDWCVNDRVFSGETVRWEVHNQLDGRWYQMNDTLLKRPDGRVSKQSLIRDITSQKLMEQELRHALESQRVLFESLPVGVIAVDEHFSVIQINPWAQAITGLSLGQALGRRCSDVLGCGEDPLCPLKRSIAEARPVGPDDWQVNSSGGGKADVRFRAAAIFDQNGELKGGVETFQDISEIKTLERNRARIISMLAHDMKTPLISIRGFADLLLRKDEKLTPQNRKKYIKIIESESARLEGFVHRFLEMSRLQDGAVELEPHQLDLTKEVKQLLDNLKPLFKAAKVSLELQCPDSAPLMADPELLGRVFGNLLDNALQHSPRGATVKVAISSSDEEIMVRVADQGQGIDPDEVALIFQPFFRGRGGKSRQGYGLGLAAARAIAKLHGGRLVVDSEPGKGSVFTLRLPVQGNNH